MEQGRSFSAGFRRTKIRQQARSRDRNVDEEEPESKLYQQYPQQHDLQAVALRVGAKLACCGLHPQVSGDEHSEEDE